MVVLGACKPPRRFTVENAECQDVDSSLDISALTESSRV